MITGKQLIADAEKAGYNLVSAYTRADALDDGEQIDISDTAKEAGFRYPVYITRAAWASAVEAGGTWKEDEDGKETLILPLGQDVQGRMWDVLNVMRWKIKTQQDICEFSFRVSVFAYDGKPHRHDVELWSQVGPVDADDPSPAITIMTEMDL
jgi:hypothetical protein